MLIVLFAELCLRDAENSFRMIENMLNMLDKPSLSYIQSMLCMLYALKRAKHANFSTIGKFVNLLMHGLEVDTSHQAFSCVLDNTPSRPCNITCTVVAGLKKCVQWS